MPTTAPVIPQSQIIFVYLTVGLVVAGTIMMLVLKLLIWLGDRRAGVTYEWQTPAPREPTRVQAWAVRLAEDAEARHAPRRVMPSAGDAGRGKIVVVAPVDQPIRSADQPIATGDNAINAELPDNPLLPSEVREIIRFQAKVEALAQLIRDGQVTNMAKGIEKAFQCSRSSKEESTYQRALLMLKPMVADKPEYRRTPDQVDNRKELGLE